MEMALTDLHTPTPWHTGGTGNAKAPMKSGETARVWATDDAAICEISTRRTLGDKKNPTEQANATFIVRACNAHDELVAALQMAAGFIEAHDETHKDGATIAPTYTAIRAALAKVQA